MRRTKILEHNPWVEIEKSGVYKGIWYICAFNLRMGIRLGYVILPKETFDLVDVDDIEVHGGITYSEITDNYPIKFNKEYHIIGFDCGHYGDEADFEAWEKYINELKDKESIKSNLDIVLESMKIQKKIQTGEHWTIEDVEKECRKVIDQLLEKYNANFEVDEK